MRTSYQRLCAFVPVVALPSSSLYLSLGRSPFRLHAARPQAVADRRLVSTRLVAVTQGVLEERPIDGLRRTPATTSLAYSNYMERRGIWRVHRLMTRSVKVEDHVGDAVSEGEELGGRKYMAVLQRRRW